LAKAFTVVNMVVGMAEANQVIRMFLQILLEDSYKHLPSILIGRTATLTLDKPEHIVEHTMTANLRDFYKVKHIKAIRSIVKLHC